MLLPLPEFELVEDTLLLFLLFLRVLLDLLKAEPEEGDGGEEVEPDMTRFLLSM